MRAAVAAYVVKGAHFVVVIPQDEDALAKCLNDEEVSGVADPAGMSCAEPLPVEYSRHFLCEYIRGRVVAALHGFRTGLEGNFGFIEGCHRILLLVRFGSAVNWIQNNKKTACMLRASHGHELGHGKSAPSLLTRRDP